jgi:haloacetate dehalogenase
VFDSFILEQVDVGDVALRVRYAGEGPPVVLLHGHPRTHTTWHRVAPLLAEAGHTVVCPDLRGYGQSSQPPTTDDHAPYSKRAMAGDIVGLMRALGHERFSVAGHDRGSCVAYRLALDHPHAVDRLVIMDGLPLVERLERCNATFAAAYWHWWFLGQTDKPAERVICADPDAWYNAEETAKRMSAEAYADWSQAIHDPAVVHGMCEDYRAGLGIDREHDEADRAEGRRIVAPTCVLWASDDDMEQLVGDPLPIWRDWCVEVTGHAIDSGHHMAEDAPDELAAAIADFLNPKGSWG